MQENHLSVSFKARYFSSTEAHAGIRKVIFVLHGYGMLAQYFLQKFKPLFADDTLVIAPEGLSRFYLQGFNGRVGATWMTKEDRQTDIENYVTYLDTLAGHIATHCPNAEFHLLGFSQGAATVSRWVMLGQPKWSKLILWAGLFPPDLPFELANEKISPDQQVYVVYGNQDPYLKEDHIQSIPTAAEKLHISPIILTFEGEHELHTPTLKQIFNP